MTTKGQIARTTPQDPTLEARLEREFKDICKDLRASERGELKRHILQGKRIEEHLARYTEFKSRSSGIKSQDYGSERKKKISLQSGCSLATIEDRVRLWTMVKTFGEHDLTDRHYLILYGYFLAKKGHNEIKQLLKEASQKSWTAEDTLAAVISIVGRLTAQQKDINQQQIEKRDTQIQKKISEAIKVMEEALGGAKPEQVILDKVAELWVRAVDLMGQLRDMHRADGRKLTAKQHLGVIPSTEKMSIRYVGSKKDQVDISLSHLDACVGLDRITRAADVFSGRANMAFSMKQKGWDVTANDKLTWASGWAHWCVESDKLPITIDEVRALFKKGKTHKKFKFISEVFAKPYRGPLAKMSMPNAKLAELYLSNLDKLKSESKQKAARMLLAATIFDHIPFSGSEEHGVPQSLIYNLETAVYEHHSQYASYAGKLKGTGHATNQDATDFLDGWKGDLLYFDPPYSQKGNNYYDSTIPESVACGRLITEEELSTDYITRDKDKVRSAFKKLFHSADKSADVWMIAWHDKADFEWWRLARIVNDYRAITVLRMLHKNQLGTAGQEKENLGEILMICVPYPAWLDDQRILPDVRRNNGTPYNLDVWSAPGRFVDEDDPRMPIPKITRNDDGTLNVNVRLLDSFPNCEEIIERETAKLMPKVEAAYKALLAQEKADGEPQSPDGNIAQTELVEDGKAVTESLRGSKGTKAESRMYADTETWNPFKGCEFECSYCVPSFQRQAKRQKHNCDQCYRYVPHTHPERLTKIPKAKTVFVCGNGDISYCEPEFFVKIINAICKSDSGQTFYLQTKKPAFLKPFLKLLPQNVILVTTLETNRDDGYAKVSKAPVPSKRFKQFLGLKYPRKIVTIEPIMDFDVDVFSDWIVKIAPEYVWMGLNSQETAVKLPEPSPEKLYQFSEILLQHGIPVRGKHLRNIELPSGVERYQDGNWAPKTP